MDLTSVPFDGTWNFKKGRRGGLISHIVIHAMIGSFEGTRTWFKNTKSQVSCHYLVSKKGDVLQMVKDEDSAWHVCLANPFCVGVELEDLTIVNQDGKRIEKTCLNDPGWFSSTELDITAQLTAALMQKHNILLKNVIGHDDPFLKQYGNNHRDPSIYFPWLKFRSLVDEKFKAL